MKRLLFVFFGLLVGCETEFDAFLYDLPRCHTSIVHLYTAVQRGYKPLSLESDGLLWPRKLNEFGQANCLSIFAMKGRFNRSLEPGDSNSVSFNKVGLCKIKSEWVCNEV